MIKLFNSDATTFTTNGVGDMSDAVSCMVTEELNGQFELEMEYPITGKRYSDLSLREIIVAKSNPYSEPQAFRIYFISKPIGGIVTIQAEHISYDMTGYPAQPFTATSVSTALTNLKNASLIVYPYTFWTDKTNVADLEIVKPMSTRGILGNEILTTYQGEYEFDNYTVKLWEQRGTNRGVTIRYGKNLLDLKQEENCSAIYTAVYPYWYTEEDGLVQLPERYLLAPGSFDFARIYPLDLTSEFDEKPTTEPDLELMRTKSQYYMQLNGISIPRVSLTVSLVLLSQSEEYKNYAMLENIFLGDTVTVEFLEMGVNSIARCVRTIYDAMLNKYDKIELGHAFQNLASSIASQNQVINNVTSVVPTKSFVREAIDNATALITGASGGHVVIHSTTEGGPPEEILIMNTDDIATATKVWRWNSGGLGYSSTGYAGEYGLAMTMDGAIVASKITSGKIQASQIEAGSITANELSLTYQGAVSNEITTKISAFKDGLEFSVTNGSTSSTLKLMSGATELSSASITFSGIVTFESLSTSSPGTTVINGDNITTGRISATYIGANAKVVNNQPTAIQFSSPILLDSEDPSISGIDYLNFNANAYITDVESGYSGYLTLSSYSGVRIPLASGLYVKKIKNDANLSIDAYDNDYGRTIYIGTKKVSDENYAIAQKISIGSDDLSLPSTINIYGTFKHNTYTVLDSNNISSYVVFQ